MRTYRSAIFAFFAAACLSGCASKQLVFQPWSGIPDDVAAELKRGEFRAAPDQVFDAMATTLEHEPYLHWSIESLDKANGFIKANASLLREIQVRVVLDAAGNSRSKASISIPRRELKVLAKIWSKNATGFQTAYEPEAKDLGDYYVHSAHAELGADYFYSFAWRVLNDKSQVPFKLMLQGEGPKASVEPVPINEAPAP
jgi:hypothetical protein